MGVSKESNSYTFPFDTCETPNKKGIAQPYSVLTNIISCCIILYFLCYTTHFHTFLLLFSLFIFEVFHTFSHFIHIKGKLLYTLIHIAGFFVNVSFLNFMYHYTQQFPNNYYLLFLVGIIIVDIYCFFNLSFIYFLLTQILLFFAILCYYYPYLSSQIKYNIHLIILFIFIIYICFLNEKINCKRMLKTFPNFPFHAIIEVLGIIPIYLLVSTFYNL